MLIVGVIQATEERYRNKGVYIILQAPDFTDPQFRSFEAVTPRPKVVVSYFTILVMNNLFGCI